MRSYERQENGLVPTIHMGPLVATMEKKGERTFIGDMNRDIKKYNNLMASRMPFISCMPGWANTEHVHRRKINAEVSLARRSVNYWQTMWNNECKSVQAGTRKPD